MAVAVAQQQQYSSNHSVSPVQCGRHPHIEDKKKRNLYKQTNKRGIYRKTVLKVFWLYCVIHDELFAGPRGYQFPVWVWRGSGCSPPSLGSSGSWTPSSLLTSTWSYCQTHSLFPLPVISNYKDSILEQFAPPKFSPSKKSSQRNSDSLPKWDPFSLESWRVPDVAENTEQFREVWV